MNIQINAGANDRTVPGLRMVLRCAVVTAIIVFAGGCLRPATLRPVATQNSENIGNYNENVAAMAQALIREVDLHCGLEVEMERLRLSFKLIGLMDQWPDDNGPADKELADPNNVLRKDLQEQIRQAQDYKRALGNGRAAGEAVAARYPVVADIVFETPGFSEIRVIKDAAELVRIVGKREQPGGITANATYERMEKRDSLLDQYLPVRMKRELMQSYQDALAQFVSVVLEQGQVAAGHANSILAYAQAKPELSTLKNALRDEDFQNRIVTIVREKEGPRRAARVEDCISRANDLLRIVDGLKGMDSND